MVKNLLIRPYLRDVFLSKDSGINWIYPRFPIFSVKIKGFFGWDSSCSNCFYHKKNTAQFDDGRMHPMGRRGKTTTQIQGCRFVPKQHVWKQSCHRWYQVKLDLNIGGFYQGLALF